MGLVPKYYQLAGDTSLVSILFLTEDKDLSHRGLMLPNHYQNVHIPVYSVCMGIGNTLIAFKTN